MRTRIVNIHDEACDVYVGRPSKWGNPYSHKPNTLAKYRVRTVKEALEKYEYWIWQQPELLKVLKKELQGRRLGCHCYPNQCHANILAKMADMTELIFP